MQQARRALSRLVDRIIGREGGFAADTGRESWKWGYGAAFVLSIVVTFVMFLAGPIYAWVVTGLLWGCFFGGTLLLMAKPRLISTIIGMILGIFGSDIVIRVQAPASKPDTASGGTDFAAVRGVVASINDGVTGVLREMGAEMSSFTPMAVWLFLFCVLGLSAVSYLLED